MDIDSLNLRPCKYRVKQCIFKIQGRSNYELDPSYITEIYIDKDFDNLAYPYFELTLSLPPSTYRDMRRKNSELRCFLELQYAYTENTMNGEQSSSQLMFETILQDTFYIFLADNTPDMQSSFTKTYEDSVNLQHDNFGIGDMVTTRIILYNEEYLFRGRTIVNTVLQNATLLDGVTYTITKAKESRIYFLIDFQLWRGNTWKKKLLKARN